MKKRPQIKCIMLVEDHRVFDQGLTYVLDQEPDYEVAAHAGSLAESHNLRRLGGFNVAV